MANWFKQLFTGSTGPRQAARSRTFSYAYEVPSALGVREELAVDATGLINRLEAALDEPYLRQVQSRVLSRHPEINDAKYNWTELEMKRFFMLTTLLRHVPMYSDDADLVWHEMLMFTREYQQFCDEFAGFYIHHQPNVNPAAVGMDAQTNERAVFELVYSALFNVRPENERLLGPFHRRKISPALMEDLESMDAERLRSALGFRESSDPQVITTLQDSILTVIVGQTQQAQSYHDESHMGMRSAYFGVDPLWTMLAFGLATDLSPFDPRDMDHDNQSQDASVSPAWMDNSGHGGHDGGRGDDGGDVGGSSCSSDGGGSSCGSGCGSS